MPIKRADVIAAKDLSRSIDRAVALAVKRHAVKAEPSNLLINWEILGRINTILSRTTANFLRNLSCYILL